MSELKLMYIAGSGRSGSTLLARLLAEVPGFLNVGEAAHYLLNEEAFRRGVPCGCGRAVAACDVWRNELRHFDAVVRAAASRDIRSKTVPLLLSPWQASRFRSRVSDVRGRLAGLYHRLARRSGARVIVESSKHPAFGFILADLPEIDARFVHLVRDPRAVVGSWSVSKGYIERMSFTSSALGWLRMNALVEVLFRVKRGGVRLRYEDFVSQPRSTLEALVAFMGEPPGDLPFLVGSVARIGVQHMLGGNPDKLNHTSEIRIAPKRVQLPANRECALLALTLPLALRYGYLRRRHNG